ncbi:uncharacterized protein LOC121366389 [Gigantopelta aegis]|uniref:uncharacterized protein LOC121366389 n=1 Tax=Gigantopelta aegis TaxID=1735272 RepID=UPI001B88C22C|nr:uncharacterized protein LOC121366389 [Gigantopelta aegis]
MAVCKPRETVEVDKDHLCCCICTNLLTVPKMLGCGHTFCRQCLQNYIEHQKEAVQLCGFDCPLCKQFTTIPNPVAGWADQFTTDFRIQAIIGNPPDPANSRDIAEDSTSLKMRNAAAEKQKFTLKNTVRIKANGDQHKPKLTDVIVLYQEGGEVIVICDNANVCVKAFYFDSHKDMELTSKLIITETNYHPHKVAKINETQIAVSCFQSTKIFIINVNNGLSIHTTIDTGVLNRSIAVVRNQTKSSPDIRLVIGYDRGMSIINMSGVVIKTMDVDICGETYIQQPWYLAVTPANNIIVSDKENCLLCISQKREVLWKYPTQNPMGVDCDTQGNIYLATGSENKVVLLSPNGVFLKDILINNDNIEEPYRVFFDHVKERLYIAEHRGLIKVFGLEG